MIQSCLEEVRRVVDGVRAVMLVDGHGMLVAGVGGERAALDVVAASYADIARRTTRANRDAELEAVSELMATGEFGAVVYHVVTGEYALLVLLAPEALVGHARYALRQTAAALIPELAA